MLIHFVNYDLASLSLAANEVRARQVNVRGTLTEVTRIREDRPSPEVACSLTTGELSQRQDRWQWLGEHADADTLSTADGVQLVFDAAPGVEAELEQLVALERDCCGFATWSVQTRGDQLVLTVTAKSEEGIAAVQGMFNKLATSIAAARTPSGARSAAGCGRSAYGERWPSR
jgi:hypothetical protein